MYICIIYVFYWEQWKKTANQLYNDMRECEVVQKLIVKITR
jgi:hypothetical protein